jgi:hypothetical protein
MISKERAQQLCEVHSFFYSDLEKFSFDGIYRPELCLVYLMEIEQHIIAPESALRPYEHTKKHRKELGQLEKYFTKLCPYPFEWTKHPQYGYRVPQLLEHTPDVHDLRLPI